MADSNLRTMWAIRDNAVRLGLKAHDLAILYTVEARGVAMRSADDLAAEMGMGRSTFDKKCDDLISRGLLIKQKRGMLNHYRVNVDALRPPTEEVANEEGPPTEDEVPLSEDEVPLSEDEVPLWEEHKKNKKRTMKKNQKSGAESLSFSEREQPSPEGMSNRAGGAVTFGSGSLDEFLGDQRRTAEAASRRSAEQAERIRMREASAAEFMAEAERMKERGLSDDQAASFLEGISL